MNVVLPFTKRTTAAVTVFTCIFAAQKAQALTSNPTLLGALNTEYVQLFDVYKWLCHQDVPNQAARLDRTIARASVLINELYATVLEIVSTKQNHVRLSIIQAEVAAAVQVMVNLMSLQPVTSVFGRTGAVTAQFGDYSFPQISGLLPQSQLATPTPAWINVKTYGATGNTQENATASTTENLPIITCAGAFAPADVGKRIYVVGNAGVVILPTTTIIGFVNSSSVTVAGAGPTSSQSDVTVVWGTDDTTAIKAAVTAAGTSGTVYVPLGAYLFNPGATGLFDINGGPFRIIGDGMAQTVFHPDPSGTYPSNTNLGFFFESSGTSANDIILADFTIDGVLASIPTSTAINISGNGTLYNVAITGLRSASVGIFLTGNSTNLFNCEVSDCQYGLLTEASDVSVYGCYFGNNFVGNVKCTNVNSPKTGPTFRMFGGLIDETQTDTGSLNLQNSTAVWLHGVTVWASHDGPGIAIDATSAVHLVSCYVGPFNTNNNCTGISIASGGTACAIDSILASSGTGYAVNIGGTFNDLGGNQITNTTGSGTFTSPIVAHVSAGTGITVTPDGAGGVVIST